MPEAAYRDGPWLILAPTVSESAKPNEAGPPPEERDLVLFRRDEPSAPVALLEVPAPPVHWLSITVTADGHVVGRASNGLEYAWPIFSDRNQFIDFARSRLPLKDGVRITLTDHSLCLIGLRSGDACVRPQQPGAE